MISISTWPNFFGLVKSYLMCRMWNQWQKIFVLEKKGPTNKLCFNHMFFFSQTMFSILLFYKDLKIQICMAQIVERAKIFHCMSFEHLLSVETPLVLKLVRFPY